MKFSGLKISFRSRIVVIAIGISGFFLIQEPEVKTEDNQNYFGNIFYGFRPSVVKENGQLYLTLLCVAVYNISIQIFMPYLILYYTEALGMDNYVLIFAPAIVLAAVFTGLYGKVYDTKGFRTAVIPTVLLLMAGYVFLCVDNIDLRREIAEKNRTNVYIKAMFDFRIRLTDAQHYAARWGDRKAQENFLNTMQFTHEEAKRENPVSACNVELSVVPTVRQICSVGVVNFINFVKSGGEKLKKMILVDAFDYGLDAF